MAANQITAFLDPTQLPARTQDQTTFDGFMALFMQQLPTFGAQFNAGVANFNAAAAGCAYAIPYTIDLSGTTDVDPGAGKLRFDNAVQNLATTLRLDLSGSNAVDYTAMLDTFDASTSAVRGAIRVVKLGDASKFLLFNVINRTAPSGYRDIVVVCTASSAANPFVNGDAALLFFQRNGDVGSPGTNQKRVTSLVNQASVAPNAGAMDTLAVSGQAQQLALLTPTGTLYDGQPLTIRVKDNGTSQLLAFSGAYRAGTDIPLPTSTTAGKVLYVGLIYNQPDAKWDLVSVLTNI